ncbi:MAG: Mur ligase family protein [Acidimicrobiales bacterium]
MKIAVAIALGVLLVVAYGAQMARWLRVLQREHYDSTSLMRFLARWSSPQRPSAKAHVGARPRRPVTLSQVLILAMIVTILFRQWDLLVVVTAGYGIFCPVGLSIRGRTSKLEWTRRLRTIAIVATVISVVIAVAAAFSAHPFLGGVVMVLAVNPVLNLVTRALRPMENRRAQRFVDQATRRLSQIEPRIVAITGSYGKTSTKNYLSTLLGSNVGAVASPRSFNNRAGLSRAINENLADGTQVFIAEMGTYGPGEIRELTAWCAPEIAVVTAIGPVHLERMKSVDVIEAAKREITERASTVVLNVDDPRLGGWVSDLRTQGKRVVTAGSKVVDADVRVASDVHRWTVTIAGAVAAELDEIVGVQPTNLACAIAVARELGVDDQSIAARVSDVQPAANRLNVATSSSGILVVDDTFNANPASAMVALKTLASLDVTGRRVVVTPGLVELGAEQYSENLRLAQLIEAVPAELVAIGRTNILALSAGYSGPPRRFDTRHDAVKWIRSVLVPGDGVLFLNDLPDHYP